MSAPTDVAAATPSGAGPASRLDRAALTAVLAGRPPLRSATTGAFLAGAALIVATAAIHLHLYLTGYRSIPTLGVLFILQAISGFVIGAALLVGRHLLSAAIGAGFMLSSAVGLILSATVGFVGVHDNFATPWATPAVAVELAGFVVLSAALGPPLYRLVHRPAGRP